MKIFNLTLCLLLMIMTANAQNWHKNKVIAHRGAWKMQQMPENSIESLKEAFRLQCYGSEFDVWLTADSIPVVNHDADFLDIDIETSTYAQLLTKKLPNGEQIPTLASFLEEGMKQKSTKLILEMKPSRISKARGQLLASICVKMVEDMKAKNWVNYISFDYDILKRVKELQPKAHVEYLNGDVNPTTIHADKFSGMDYNQSVFKKNPEWLTQAKKLKLVTNVWTVNSKEDLLWFLEKDVDFITTNEPELLFELIKQKN